MQIEHSLGITSLGRTIYHSAWLCNQIGQSTSFIWYVCLKTCTIKILKTFHPCIEWLQYKITSSITEETVLSMSKKSLVHTLFSFVYFLRSRSWWTKWIIHWDHLTHESHALLIIYLCYGKNCILFKFILQELGAQVELIKISEKTSFMACVGQWSITLTWTHIRHKHRHGNGENI